jgi:CRP-like cAMP-binding protein
MKKTVEIPSCNTCKNSKDFFCNLSDSEKQSLSEKKGDNFYKKGQVIFYEGNHANGLYCLFEGKVKLTKLGKDGKEQIIRFSKDGDILGYRSLLSNEPYHATAMALEDSYICMITKDKFLQIVEDNPKLSLKVIQLLSKDLKGAEQHLIDVAQKTVKERISESLILLKNTFGYLIDGQTLNVTMSRAEIADMAGTTTESTIRTLAQLQEEKLIKLEGKTIVISNLNGLIRCTNTYD